jgi:DNA-directed RNA polymerase specialized sigma24 family protein
MSDTQKFEDVPVEAPTHYVRNKDLIPEIKQFNDVGFISEELGRMLLLIAKNLSNKGNFINYTWKEDMIQEAVLTCCKYLKNFDLEKSNNPFAYITTICNHAFVNYINKQKKHSEIKDKCFHNRDTVIEDDTFTYSYKAIDYTVMSNEEKKKKTIKR